ncbi:hypothetical protein ABZ712_19585 [Streptomyces sp. NPDC006906]|uniref:hypothetical protein n=1 Tax=unclassified Streptomyces TaxID=2593676 RepID=UPI0033D6849C
MQGMSFTDVLTQSGAARGAIYHHFPGGKNQLATEAAVQHGGLRTSRPGRTDALREILTRDART